MFTYSSGGSSPTTVYESASTSKWVSAVVLLDLVESGVLDLDDTAQQWLPSFWLEPDVKLRHLLSFTSGFSEDHLCSNLPGQAGDSMVFQDCVEKIYEENRDVAPAAGSEFYYSSTHLQVAGLMAMKATSSTFWGEVFEAFQQKTGVFPTAVYDLPSEENPRLAGGMHWNALEYHDFLRALYQGTLLQDATRQMMFESQRGIATVGMSPAYARLKEDWAYGFGNWLECPTATSADSYDCGPGTRNSSPGGLRCISVHRLRRQVLRHSRQARRAGHVS